MIRIDVNSGHGASNLKKGLETAANTTHLPFLQYGADTNTKDEAHPQKRILVC